MKHKKILLIIPLLFLVLVPSVYAVSSSFFSNAQKWYNSECVRRPDRVRGEEAVLCYAFDKVNELNTQIGVIKDVNSQQDSDISELKEDISSQSAEINDLKERIEKLEHPNTPTPSPMPTKITVTSGQSFNVPNGFKSMTIKVYRGSDFPGWSPIVSTDGVIYREQIRLTPSELEITIPILGSSYKLSKGGSQDFTAEVTFNVEPDARVILFGNNISYQFLSNEFDTSGYSSITINAGGGDNPQHLTAITLLKKLSDGGFANQSQITCDGGARCPMQTLNVDGGIYKVRLEGSGTNAVMGAILRP